MSALNGVTTVDWMIYGLHFCTLTVASSGEEVRDFYGVRCRRVEQNIAAEVSGGAIIYCLLHPYPERERERYK